MEQNKDTAARFLAEAHYRIDPGIQAIRRIIGGDEGDPREPVKLLEVNAGTPMAGVMPIYFGADARSEIYYPSVIVEIHPQELLAVEAGRLPLPHAWKLGECYARPA